jgi:hypothetical protein
MALSPLIGFEENVMLNYFEENVMLNYVLPVPCWSVVVLLLVSITITTLSLITLFNAGLWKKLLIFPIFISGLISIISLIVWLLVAGCSCPEVDYEEDLPIQVVIYPSGKHVQMFAIGTKLFNANEMFGAYTPEKRCIKRIVFKKTYYGITYAPDTKESLLDQYSICDGERITVDEKKKSPKK